MGLRVEDFELNYRAVTVRRTIIQTTLDRTGNGTPFMWKDYPKGKKPRRVTLGKTARELIAMDVCEPDRERLIGCLLELGFVPTKAQVGKNRRGAYVAHSGKTFTTKDARLWLVETGHDVAGSGRLTADQLQTYAAAH